MKRSDQLVRLMMLITLFFTINSCEKPAKFTTVRGHVTDKLTGKGVANIPINVMECDYGMYFGGSSRPRRIFKTFYTDINGNYIGSFESHEKKYYEVCIGINEILPGDFYGDKIEVNLSNTVDFSVKPYKILQLKLKVLRHDKNWIFSEVGSCDGENFWKRDLYNGPNPTSNLDSTYNIKIQAGRTYKAGVNFCNKIADREYENIELFDKLIYIDNIDTTKVQFTIQ